MHAPLNFTHVKHVRQVLAVAVEGTVFKAIKERQGRLLWKRSPPTAGSKEFHPTEQHGRQKLLRALYQERGS